jgi:predicted DNA-binding WGR domain protein
VQVRAAALSLSPVFRAARGTIPAAPAEAERGLGLRFPRFIRARPDKRPTDATSSTQLAAMFAQQPEAHAASAAAAVAAAETETTGTGGGDTAAAADGATGATLGEVAPRSAGTEAGDALAVRGEMASKSGGKFWEARTDGTSLTVRFGKVGSKGQAKTSTFETAAAARQQLQKLRADKEKKGYAFL